MTANATNESLIEGPIHSYFGLSYANYLVLPRLGLQTMPHEWQRRFVALLEECAEAGLIPDHSYCVTRRVKGRFIEDPWADYRRGDARAFAGREGEP